jgi:hypothetical protein
MFCYVSPHVICKPEGVAETVDFYVKYLAFLWDILPENSYPMKGMIIP